MRCRVSDVPDVWTVDAWRITPRLQRLCPCERSATPLMVDVGTSSMASGVDALEWWKQNHSRRTVGFEAHPVNCADVRRAFAASGQRFVCKAVSDAPGNVTLTGSGQGALVGGGPPSGERHIVRATTLDAELADSGHVWLLKLDVQGSELHALNGARALLKSGRVSWVYTELDPHMLRAASSAGRPSSVRRLLDLLDAFGFACVNSRRRNAHSTLGYPNPVTQAATVVGAQDRSVRGGTAAAQPATQCGYSCPCKYTNILCGHHRVAVPPFRWKQALLDEICNQPRCTYREEWRGITPASLCNAPL